MATHLLDDVQQVCDHVVMIDAGRLVVAGATDSLLERTGTVTVDVGPRRDELVAALARPTLAAVAADGVVEVTVDGDDELDMLRDVIAELGLPLYRLSTRLTSLDEVFLRRAEDSVVSVVEAGGRGAVYDRGYRPVRRPRGRRGAATFALYKASIRRALGHPAVVAPEGRAVRAARRRDDPRDRQRRHRLRHPRPAPVATGSRSSPTASTSACRRRCCCSSRWSRPTSCAPTAASTCCR